MPKLVSNFSDGSQDIYNGSRAVTAGWQAKTPNGRTYTGHSMTPELAQKTALGNAMIACPDYIHSPKYAPAVYKQALAAGFKSIPAFKSSIASKRDAFRSAIKVEVVTLVAL